MKDPYILVVEDDATCCDVIDLYLTSAGYYVHYIQNAYEALDFLRENPHTCDLIILDIMMPGMSGNELLEELKADEELKNIPVIMQSGADEDAIARSQQLGAVCSIQKPYELEKLKILTQDILAKKIVSIKATPSSGEDTVTTGGEEQHVA
jgi:CheY-like chemotaxis protein